MAKKLLVTEKPSVDMRIRMPKAILENTNAIKGKTIFDVFYDAEEDAIVLKKKIGKEEDK